MDDEGDHRAEDPVVRREYDPSSDPQDREPTHYTFFDESDRAEARAKYGSDAQKEKLGAWREKKRRHVSYERQKAKKTKSRDRVRASVRDSGWSSFFHGDTGQVRKGKKLKKGKRSDDNSDGMDFMALAPMGLMVGILGYVAYTMIAQK